MSRENVEIVIRLFEAVNSRDFPAAMDAYADDVALVLHHDLRGGGGSGAVGKEAVGEWFGDWFRQFASDYRFDIEEARDLGDRVFLVATHHGRGRTSGVPVEQETTYLYTVRYGKVSRVEVWRNRGTALEAIGLSE
jgi:ketosteroid isomerase-like protein